MIRSIAVAAARSDSVGTGQADRLASPDAAGALVVFMVAPRICRLGQHPDLSGYPGAYWPITVGLPALRYARPIVASAGGEPARREQEVRGGVSNPRSG